MHDNFQSEDHEFPEIAIIGMSCRFPGAKNIKEYWENLINGQESIQRFTSEELLSNGEHSEKINSPNYVRARGIVEGAEQFDANFFGFSAADAKILDPQHRLFLECGWEALESSGYAPEKFRGLIGVYAAMAESTYFLNNILKNKKIIQTTDPLQVRIANSLTTLGTQLSYRLNLTGPSINLTTACSSSLVLITEACKSLIDYDCDIAVAGASVISIPQKRGYFYNPGGIESEDGHCRAFDEKATGTVFSDGVGVVVLKRLSDAIKDNDHIYATIKGWNVNNDGASKVGFTAPSVTGQARCILSAANFADVKFESIQYVEAHGTATAMGDPIEISAMRQAFETQTQKKQFCAIGSVKTNIGHADIAAGMAALIKTALSIKHKLIPASLNYNKSNPAIDFEDTPFYVNDKLTHWETTHGQRIAGVNSSGIGGTNAFLLLGEPPSPQMLTPPSKEQLLIVSAKTPLSLEQAFNNLVTSINEHNFKLPDVAYTLQTGRTDFNYRRAIIYDVQNNSSSINNLPSTLFDKSKQTIDNVKIAFLFSGQGSQYIGMCKDLYQEEVEFARLINEGLEHLGEDNKHKVSAILFGSKEANFYLNNTSIVQPALFIFEYALAKFLMNLGVIPDAMAGHSLGEYVAACVAGVMGFKTGLRLINIRAQLMEKTKPGSMLAIRLNESETLEYIKNKAVSIAACNSPSNTIISGDTECIKQLEILLKENHIGVRLINESNAFHSQLMEPILPVFSEELEKISLSYPTIPLVSNSSGGWTKEHEIVTPQYWIEHLKNTVRFSDSIHHLIKEDFNVFLEIGPGNTLTSFVREINQNRSNTLIHNINNRSEQSNFSQFLSTIAELWLMGVKIDWEYFNINFHGAKIPLPTYPFNRTKFWISPSTIENTFAHEKQPYSKWFYETSWQRCSLNQYPIPLEEHNVWIVFMDELGESEYLIEHLKRNEQVVYTIIHSTKYSELSKYAFQIDITNKDHYCLMLESMSLNIQNTPINVLNFLPLNRETIITDNQHEIENLVNNCFYSTLFVTQGFVEKYPALPLHILVIGNNIFSVLGEMVSPVKSTVVGPCRVIPLEHEHIQIKVLDIDQAAPIDNAQTVDNIIYEALFIEANENIVAFRKNYRWLQKFTPVPFQLNKTIHFPNNSTILFTGGTGGISLTLAKSIASHTKNPIFFLISRSTFLDKSSWSTWLSEKSPDDFISKKILILQEIETLGGKVIFYQGDVADELQLSSIINNIKKQFGSIQGVVHAAGTPGGGLVQFKTRELADKVFRPKIYGAYLLCSLLKDEPLNFFILCSSVSSVVGEASQVDYSSANACLDAFPYSGIIQNPNTQFTTINWNTWQEIGMAVETERPDSISFLDRSNDIKPEEGSQIFLDTLNNSAKQVIISTLPIEDFINQMRLHATGDLVESNLVVREAILSDHKYKAPKNQVEQKLVSIWQEIFSIDKIGVEDDFFALGGHSLTALHLIGKVERQFKITISLNTFLESATTVEKLAKLILLNPSTISQNSNIVIPLRSGGSHRPLFCFHPVAGSIFCYSSFAKHLTYDGPIYGVQDPSLNCEELLFKTLEEMSSCYIEEIKKIQPVGPYTLAGLSFGATLAADIARQLRQSGDIIQRLIFFDGWTKFSDAHNIEIIFRERIEQLYGTRPDAKRLSHLAWQRMRLLLNYENQLILEEVILFKAKTLLPEYIAINDPFNYWTKHVKGRINLHMVPGDHETILDEPNVETICKILDEILSENAF